MTKFLALTTLFLSAPLCAQQASGQSYLLLSHDPAFLEEVGRLSAPIYTKGRARLVKFTVPYASLPPHIAASVRPAEQGEISYGPAAAPEVKMADPAVLALTAKVSGSRLLGYADILTNTGKRGAKDLDASAASGNRAAMDYIESAFKDLGYETERHCYKERKKDRECNILARRRSAAPGAKIIAVVGHMDSVGHNNAGADDNASGAAGVLEMAQVLSAYASDHELLFIAANGEETGVAGTYALAKKMKASGEMSRVAWAINMDMIAWNRNGVLDIETNKEFSAYADWVAAQAVIYTKLKPYISMPAWGSDHVPFLEAGVPTYLAIENWEDHNPCYHQACDKMDTLSWTYASELVKLNLAVVAGKAKLTPLKP
ncbi:MAG: M28 family peptidase [Elusimicrobiales bacterium]|nr:M28 family peptidase [Elusimicrobiales bacterium]